MARIADFWFSLMLHSGRCHGDPILAHLRPPGAKPRRFDRRDETLVQEVGAFLCKQARHVARSSPFGTSERLPC